MHFLYSAITFRSSLRSGNKFNIIIVLVRRNNVFSKAKTAQEEEKRQLVPTKVPGDTALLLLLLFPLFTDYEDIFHPQTFSFAEIMRASERDTERREEKFKIHEMFRIVVGDIVLRIRA
jgi:hypothetical protein